MVASEPVLAPATVHRVPAVTADESLGDDGVSVKTANKQTWTLLVDYTSRS